MPGAALRRVGRWHAAVEHVVSAGRLGNLAYPLDAQSAHPVGSRRCASAALPRRIVVVRPDFQPTLRDPISADRFAIRRGHGRRAVLRLNAQDRKRLERLCRYIARPAIATERLSECEDGRIAYSFRHPWRDGTTGVLFEPMELIEKLVALVPVPRGHLVRYHGVLAAGARWRAQVVRDRAAQELAAAAVPRGPDAVPSDGPGYTPRVEIGKLRERRLTWAQLMQRVFAADVLECPRCHGRRKLIAVITEAAVIVAFLRSLGLAARAPPRGPVRELEPGEAEPGERDLPLS